MAINFNQAGSFNGIGQFKALNNPTSIQFGSDGRLYVAEQNGTINAFTVAIQNGEYVATANEILVLANGAEVVKSIQNHNDDGSLDNSVNRQVTGLVVTGTAENPVLYISSSDPRIATFEDTNLDTNSGIVTQVTWNGNEWEAVDIIRGLPRSEENHSINGMVLSPDGTKLYLTVGGNTNNGAPSKFFANTGEYVLSGAVLEIDLEDIASRPILTDSSGGQNGTSRQYIYDLPTLDDPTINNNNNGVGENSAGMDENGPWGGNDGFNMAILPADAPMRIFADGLRNQYDLAWTDNGQLYTVDNGSNTNIGGNPLDANGNVTNQPGAGEATNTPNNGGIGDPEPLFLLEDGGYYGHPAPSRSNQDLSWTVYNDDGNPDSSLSPNSVPHLTDLVPEGVNIADGFLIDPSKFTGDATRLAQSGIRIERNSPNSNALATLGSSSNGLVEYTSNVFGGALKGGLIVTQFNGNVTFLNLSDDGTSIEPLVDPTENNETIAPDGIYPLVTGLSKPLDVTTGPNGTIWVADFGPDNINIFAPSNAIEAPDLDIDNDGILNVNDPFLRDETNGGSVFVSPGQDLLWDFDANQDDNLPGPEGYGGGLTGVAIDGVTDFENFFQEPSTLPNQIIKLDNVKFNTAAGGGTTVIESVSNGDPFANSNSGEYLFHTGVRVSPTVETFNIKWSVFNPGTEFTGSFQQIGGYIGTGDQSNYLKIVAIEGLNNEVQILLEDNDVVQSQSLIQANGLFNFPPEQQIFFELEIDPTAGTAIPTVSYETNNDNIETVIGEAVNLNGTSVLEAIQGNYTVNGQDSGLAVGLFSSNTGQPQTSSFQAIFNDIEITATGDSSETVLYRVNAGGSQVAALDGDIPWSADTKNNNSSFLTDPGSNSTAGFSAVDPGATVPGNVPDAIFNTERWDKLDGSEMQWAFNVPEAGLYEVRLYMGNGFNGTNDPGERVFDVAVEDSVPTNLDNIDLSALFGHQTGGVISNTVTVNDGTLNLEFLHGVENPLVNGIEIVQLGSSTQPDIPIVSLVGSPYVVGENEGQVQISLLTNTTVPSDETVNVTFEIVPNTANALEDYVYQSNTATFDAQTGVYTDTIAIAGNSSDATFFIDIVADAIAEENEAFTVNLTDVSPNAQIGTNSASVTIEENNVSGEETIVYRVNAGGSQIAALDGDIPWSADTQNNNSSFLANPGSNSTAGFSAVDPGASVPGNVPDGIFNTERWDRFGDSEMQWAFDVPEAGLYEVRLYMGNGFNGTNDPGERVFDVAVEGVVPTNLDNIDLSALFGHQTGGVISNTVTVDDGTLNLEFFHGVENPLVNGIEIVRLDDGEIMPPPTTELGEAILGVTADSNNVQKSNFGNNSFQITNTGDKKIARVNIDVTNALYPDTVFDPFGQAGDTASKQLTINTNGGTGVIAPSNASYIGTGGSKGFEEIQLDFNDGVNGGFESGETLGFSVDMDPNSVAGAQKGPLDNGSNPSWDVGGVSGAELIGSTFTVTFDDGSTATGQLQGAGNQAGSQTLAAQNLTNIPISLTVNNLNPGNVGTYNGSPSVIINGTSGQTARVVLTKGFIQPVSLQPFLNGTPSQQQFAPILQSQLDALAASDFPANNAVEFQTVDIPLTGGNQDISNLFDFSSVSTVNIDGEDKLPLGFVASAIDPSNDNLPIGAVSQPIYLQFEENSDPGNSSDMLLYRVNAGGSQIAALDGDIPWSADTQNNNSSFLANPGSNSTAGFSAVDPGASVPGNVPDGIFNTERWDRFGGSEMQWAFDVPESGLYEVRLYMGNGFNGTSDPGERVFDVAVEGSVPANFNDIDLSAQFGHQTGGVISNTVTVNDGTLNLEFLHGVENPLVNGIEIVKLA